MLRRLRIMATRRTVNDLVLHYETLYKESNKRLEKNRSTQNKSKTFKQKVACFMSRKSESKRELVSNFSSIDSDNCDSAHITSANNVKDITENFKTDQDTDQHMCIEQSDTSSTILLSNHLNANQELDQIHHFDTATESDTHFMSQKAEGQEELVLNLTSNITDNSESANILSNNSVNDMTANYKTNQDLDQHMSVDQSDTRSRILLNDHLNVNHELDQRDSVDTANESDRCTVCVSELSDTNTSHNCAENIDEDCIWTSTMVWPCCEQRWRDSYTLKVWDETIDEFANHNIASTISTSDENISSLGNTSRQSIFSDDDSIISNASTDITAHHSSNNSTDSKQHTEGCVLPLPPRDPSARRSHNSDSTFDEQNDDFVAISAYWPVYVNIANFKSEILTSTTANTQNELHYYKKQHIYDNKHCCRKTKLSIVTSEDNKERNVLTFDNEIHFETYQLITTEEDYIKTMEYVINNYVRSLEKVIGIENTRKIFANYEKICHDTKSFLEDLKSAQFDYEKIGLQFINKKSLFERYTLFCHSKKRSQEAQKQFKKVIQARRIQMSDSMDFRDHVFQPIRRLVHYKVYLIALKKHMQKSNLNLFYIGEAIKMLHNILMNCNNIIELNLIDGTPFGLAETGQLLLRDSFKLCRKDIVVFLYQRKIILADIDTKNAGNYIFRRSINIDEIALIIQAKPATMLGIERFKNKKCTETYHLYAESVEIKNKWYKALYDILWEQLINRKKEYQLKIAAPMLISTPLEEPCPEFI